MGMKFTRRGLLKRLGLATAAAAVAPVQPATEYKHVQVALGFSVDSSQIADSAGGPVCSTFGGEVPEAMKWAFNEQVKASLRESGSIFATGEPKPKKIQFEEVSDPDSWDA